MSKAQRDFRSPESIEQELLTRDAISPFLKSRGFQGVEDERIISGSAVQQFISAKDPEGRPLKMRVRLCWHRGDFRSNKRKYSGAQLAVRPREGGWDATLDFLAERDRAHGISHNLLLQRDDNDIVYAALIPADQIGPIWHRQWAVSDELIRTGRTGRMKRNHAENGTSPALFLQDDRSEHAHLVADALWQWPGVVDVVKLPILAPAPIELGDDTFDDCPVPDYADLGRDAGQRTKAVRSEVKRDPRVRRAVLQRAGGACERSGCGIRRTFDGFLDVHHILGVEKSDRVYNCVALCPNCHREAHYAPNAADLNTELLEYAAQFQVKGAGARDA